MTPEVEEAMQQLMYLTEFGPEDGMNYREDVETLVAYIRALEQDLMSDDLRASVERGLADSAAGRVTRIVLDADAEDDWKKLV